MGEPAKAAVAPPRGSSVYFALGGPREDLAMRAAHAWAKDIVAAGGPPAVQCGSALSYVALTHQLTLLYERTPPLELDVDGKMFASHYLGGNTLVLVMNRLPAGGPHGSGLLVYGHHGLLASDITISTGMLDAMSQPPPGGVRSFADPATQLLVLLSIIHQYCDNLYLCGVGRGAPLAPLATRLKALLGLRVFYNDGGVRFLAPTHKAQVADDAGNEVRGTPFSGDGSVELTTGPNDFFRGAEHAL